MKKKSGFTLVELLVVIAIIGILIAMLLPAVQQVREAGRRTVCMNNVKQIALSMHNYESAHRNLPVGWNTIGALWSAYLLPFMEQENLFNTLQLKEAYNWNVAGSPNQKACATILPQFRCPNLLFDDHYTHNRVNERVPVSYRGVGASNVSADKASRAVPGTKSFQEVTQNGLFYGCSETRFADIFDGLSNTFAVGESRTDPSFKKNGNSSDHWAIGSPDIDSTRCDGGSRGGDYSEAVGSTYWPLNLRLRDPAASGHAMTLSFGSFHPTGLTIFGMADGSVHIVQDGVDLTNYQNLGGRDDGFIVSLDF